MKLKDIQKPLIVRLLQEKAFMRRPRSLEELCNHFRAYPAQIREALEAARAKGFNFTEREEAVQLSDELAPRPPTVLHTESFFGGKVIRYGAVSDSHLGSKYERLDVNETLYDCFKREGLSTVYHLGNAIDGEAKGINTFDLHTSGMDNQCEYFLKIWPRRKGISTHFITGACHEGWYSKREGIDVGAHIMGMAQTHEDAKCRRSDLVYLGHVEHDLKLMNRNGETAWLRLFHPGGGSAYATSYKGQKIVESYQGGEKPDVLMLGHFHKMNYDRPREVLTLNCGTTCDQTPFMRLKHLQANVGGWIVELHQAPDGHISRARFEDIRFFDRKFYQGQKFPISHVKR